MQWDDKMNDLRVKMECTDVSAADVGAGHRQKGSLGNSSVGDGKSVSSWDVVKTCVRMQAFKTYA